MSLDATSVADSGDSFQEGWESEFGSDLSGIKSALNGLDLMGKVQAIGLIRDESTRHAVALGLFAKGAYDIGLVPRSEGIDGR